jgi:hypothetical protein
MSPCKVPVSPCEVSASPCEVPGSPCDVPGILSSFKEVRISRQILIKAPNTKCYETSPAAVELLHTDGQAADVTKLIGAFLDLCEHTPM